MFTGILPLAHLCNIIGLCNNDFIYCAMILNNVIIMMMMAMTLKVNCEWGGGPPGCCVDVHENLASAQHRQTISPAKSSNHRHHHSHCHNHHHNRSVLVTVSCPLWIVRRAGLSTREPSSRNPLVFSAKSYAENAHQLSRLHYISMNL